MTEDAASPGTSSRAALDRLGVGCGVYYPKLVIDYDCYRGDRRVVPGETPVAARVARQCVSLPVHPALTPDQLATVIGAVRELLGAPEKDG